MKCHDIQRMIAGFIDERLSDEQLENFLDHIAGCQDCYDELEVYYMITKGLKQLDENHSETLDLKRNLRDFIQQQRQGLYMRKRAAVRKKHLKTAGVLCVICLLIFGGYVFLSSEEGIHSAEEFSMEAKNVLEDFFFGVQSEDANEAEEPVLSPVERHTNFEMQHPLIPSYMYQVDFKFPHQQSIIEKDR